MCKQNVECMHLFCTVQLLGDCGTLYYMYLGWSEYRDCGTLVACTWGGVNIGIVELYISCWGGVSMSC